MATQFPFAEKTADPREGYKITKTSGNLAPQALAQIEAKAFPAVGKMPSSQWQYYKRASGLKAFPLNPQEMAVSHYRIAAEKDATGRSGNLTAYVEVVPLKAYRDYLESIYRAILQTRGWSDSDIPRLALSPLQKVLTALMGKQFVFSYPFTNPKDWDYVEAYLLRFVLNERLTTAFATLALSADRDVQIVAIPTKEAVRNHISAIEIPKI